MNSPNEMPLVSIVMNCYNGEKYLKEAIDSIYSQTYKNWEIIFWDNASTDKSSKIAQTYDKKLKYFQASLNTKLYEARNNALKQCDGRYVAFLDCDDVWLDHCLETQIIYATMGYDFVYGQYQNIDSEGKIISNSNNQSIDKLSSFSTNDLFKSNPISIGSALIKKSLLLEHKFNPYFQLLGDYDLWVRLSIDNKITPLNKVVEFSRQHNANTSNLLAERWLKERRFFYKQYCTFSNFVKYPMLIYYMIKTEIRGISNSR